MATRRDPLDFDAQERETARGAKAREAEMRRMRDDLRRVASSEHGRRVLYRLVERAGVFRLSFTPDALAMAFAEGRRNEGLTLLADIEDAAPEQWESARREIAASRIQTTDDDDDDTN